MVFSGNNPSKKLSAPYLIVLKCRRKARKCSTVTWTHDCCLEHPKAESHTGNGSRAGHQGISHPLPASAQQGQKPAQQGQVQPTGMEGIALERKAQVNLCLWTVIQCDFQVLAQEISFHFLWSCSTPWKRNSGGVIRLGFISPNFRHLCSVCLCLTQSSRIFAIRERNSCSLAMIHPPGLA